MKRFLILLALAAVTISGCADANGLHNQEAAAVTFVLENVPAPDGDYALPGSWQKLQWDNTETLFSLSGGSAVGEPVSVTAAAFTFSLVPVGSWDRPWYPAMKGNAWDTNSGGNQWNFEISGLPLGRAVTVTIDGGTSPASVTIE